MNEFIMFAVSIVSILYFLFLLIFLIVIAGRLSEVQNELRRQSSLLSKMLQFLAPPRD